MKIYFLQRAAHRKRQRETVEFCPDAIDVLKPQGIDFIKDTSLSGRENYPFKQRIRGMLARAVPLNCRRITDVRLREADFVYTWACIPFFSSKPYVVEIDNPYALCFYNMYYFKCLKPVLRRILLSEKCKSIVCISHACLKNLEVELGADVASKARVVYPYMKNNLLRTEKKDDGIIRFLFVSTQFYLKGGRETIKAFSKAYTEHNNIHLTIVSNVPNEIKEEYEGNSWVSFVKADLDKEVLHRDYFENSDVFILPSYQDSLGMVYLEALSFGLPIIATKMYAVPEFVEDGVNGFVFDPPFPYFNDDFTMNQDLPKNLPEKIYMDNEYPKIVEETYRSIIELMDDNRRKEMSRKSAALFLDKFDSAIRDQTFINVFKR